MGRKYAEGKKAVGICQRCSKKQLRRDMVEDGYYPSLIVCKDCRDERHPQERLPKLDDPTTLYKPAPDDIGTPPDLSGEIVGTTATLTWTEAVPINARIDSYILYRRVLGTTDWTEVVDLPVTYDVFMAITSQTLTYDDTGLTAGTTYEYYVDARTAWLAPDSLASNTVELQTEVGETFFRLLETGEYRLMESNPADRRLLEEAP